MMQLMLYSMIMMTSLMFLQMNHPLAMGLILLIQTILVCSISGLISQTFWFSYILFLIFLGGLLVLFIYVASLASNEIFKMSTKLMTISLITFVLMVVIMMTNKYLMYQFIENNEMMKTKLMTILNQENSLNLMKLYNYPTSMITTMLVLYLLITLVATVKITSLYHGPLRQYK